MKSNEIREERRRRRKKGKSKSKNALSKPRKEARIIHKSNDIII